MLNETSTDLGLFSTFSIGFPSATKGPGGGRDSIGGLGICFPFFESFFGILSSLWTGLGSPFTLSSLDFTPLTGCTGIKGRSSGSSGCVWGKSSR